MTQYQYPSIEQVWPGFSAHWDRHRQKELQESDVRMSYSNVQSLYSPSSHDNVNVNVIHCSDVEKHLDVCRGCRQKLSQPKSQWTELKDDTIRIMWFVAIGIFIVLLMDKIFLLGIKRQLMSPPQIL